MTPATRKPCQAIKRLHPEVGGEAADYARFARRAERLADQGTV